MRGAAATVWWVEGMGRAMWKLLDGQKVSVVGGPLQRSMDLQLLDALRRCRGYVPVVGRIVQDSRSASLGGST
jgi:hypothetical protein